MPRPELVLGTSGRWYCLFIVKTLFSQKMKLSDDNFKSLHLTVNQMQGKTYISRFLFVDFNSLQDDNLGMRGTR